MPTLLPLRWTASLPAADYSPLNCVYGGSGPLPQVQPEQLTRVEIAKGAEWPGVRLNNRGGAADAGPTGSTWVNANGWLVRMLQAREPGKAVWLDNPLPVNAHPASHALAVADAAAYGGHWMVTPAEATWPAVQQALRFYLAHAEWVDWQPEAQVGLISDFAGSGQYIAGEFINLFGRRQVGLRLFTPRVLTAALTQRSLVALEPLSEASWAVLRPWLREGGTLVVPYGGHARTEGKGRVLAAARAWEDPYAAVAEVHLLLTRRIDTLRLWNPGSLISYYQVEAGGKRGVVHLLNYAARESSDDVSMWLSTPWKSARLIGPEGARPLKLSPANGGIEVPLPALGIYAAVEVEA